MLSVSGSQSIYSFSGIKRAKKEQKQVQPEVVEPKKHSKAGRFAAVTAAMALAASTAGLASAETIRQLQSNAKERSVTATETVDKDGNTVKTKVFDTINETEIP